MKNARNLDIYFGLLILTCINLALAQDLGETKYTHSKTNIMSDRSQTSTIIGQLEAGQKVIVDSLICEWYAIYSVEKIGSFLGYVYAPLLKSNPPNVNLPTYTVINEDIHDVPGKMQIELRILVSGQITQIGLDSLLNKLYYSTKMRTGFKYHDHPTAIGIYAYSSREYAEAAGHQWIAMILKTHTGKIPVLQINEALLAQLCLKPQDKLGLSEDIRKEIWRQLVLNEYRALNEADKKYPDDMEKNGELWDRLKTQYDNALGKKYNLTYEQLEEIMLEAVSKEWPTP